MEAFQYSIIVPVYNAEQYLSRCVDSLLRQGLERYEIILVNDGSKDLSLHICERYAEEFQHIRVVSQENAGVCAARNRGFDEARGEWLILVDADDYLRDDGLRKAFEPFRHRTDIDVVEYLSTYDNLPKQPITNTISFDGNGHEFLKQYGIISFCWFFAYRKKFLEEHAIRFDNRYIVGEDQLFVANVLLHNPRVVASTANIYRYVITEGSATTKRDVQHTRKCVDHYLDSFRDILRLTDTHTVGEEADVRQACRQSLNSKKMFGYSRMLSSQYGKSELKRIYEKAKAYHFYPVHPMGDGMKQRVVANIMNLTMKYYIMYKPLSWLFNFIVIPYVMPRVRQNL